MANVGRSRRWALVLTPLAGDMFRMFLNWAEGCVDQKNQLAVRSRVSLGPVPVLDSGSRGNLLQSFLAPGNALMFFVQSVQFQ